MKKLSLPLKKKVADKTTPIKITKPAITKPAVADETPGITLSVYVPKELGAAIKDYASKNDRKLSYVIKQALEEYIKKHNK